MEISYTTSYQEEALNVCWPRRMLARMSHGEYADRSDRRTDGRTPDRYITLSAGRR